MALCVLSLAEIFAESERNLKIPEDLTSLISRESTMMLLNKSDLLTPSTGSDLGAENIVQRVTHALGVKHAWVVSIDRNVGINMFLRDLGKILKERWVAYFVLKGVTKLFHIDTTSWTSLTVLLPLSSIQDISNSLRKRCNF